MEYGNDRRRNYSYHHSWNYFSFNLAPPPPSSLTTQTHRQNYLALATIYSKCPNPNTNAFFSNSPEKLFLAKESTELTLNFASGWPAKSSRLIRQMPKLPLLSAEGISFPETQKKKMDLRERSATTSACWQQ